MVNAPIYLPLWVVRCLRKRWKREAWFVQVFEKTLPNGDVLRVRSRTKGARAEMSADWQEPTGIRDGRIQW